MLLTPWTYQLSRREASPSSPSFFLLTASRKEQLAAEEQARRMLLLHQTGSVKVGEVVRYTITYTPSEDRILPSPAQLHVKIKNSSAMPLRAAYLHGPYNIHCAAYPSTFNPNLKVESPKKEGVPEFEPNLKAGGSWTASLVVPPDIREVGRGTNLERDAGGQRKNVTWIVEIASQVIFSDSASVGYELLVARDEKSLDLGFTAITGNNYGTPGQVKDHQQGKPSHISHHPAQPRGVYSKAIKLVVDDITSLWNTPALPQWNDEHSHRGHEGSQHHGRHRPDRGPKATEKQKKIHLVVLTHGLHSNLGADMLYLKESIDATAKQARDSRRKRSSEERQRSTADEDNQAQASTAPLSGGQASIPEGEEDSDDEEVIVRGFEGNVIRTEKGIQYLGKRLAKHVLKMTYPDQPFLPVKKSMGKKLSNTFSTAKDRSDEGMPAHSGSSIHHQDDLGVKRAYRFTSISFIGHSLGGLVQTYAIAYIHKHSPQFFQNIRPINFIAMASPFLGLSNENPMYVKFALDFGLVGRTGQDLGLTWRAPTLARTGWTAMVSGLGNQAQKEPQNDDPGAKPLLRILPSGPAHLVLRMFRNRTVYSNVVNDGIVPLRTSCLLFLDWRGLGKVGKARRENGLIGTVAGWGWGELTGQRSSPNPSRVGFREEDNDMPDTPSSTGDDLKVPQPGADVTNEDDEAQSALEPQPHQFLDGKKHSPSDQLSSPVSAQSTSTLSTIWNYIRPSGKHTSRDKKMFRRSQTIQNQLEQADNAQGLQNGEEQPRKRPRATRGDTILNDPSNLLAPPKTTIFESAGDLLAPPVPPSSWIVDPSTRARTIFHDRVYHPEDIPPPPAKRPPKLGRSFSSEQSGSSQAIEASGEEPGGMKVEEKIARAYHKDLSWRKVLVRLEPDAHNNIVVRRMFANAYGWPVIKHLCDTHFGDTYAATTRDELEPAVDRAPAFDKPVNEDGERVKGQNKIDPPLERTESEMREVADELAPLNTQLDSQNRLRTSGSVHSKDSTMWDDSYFDVTSDDEEYGSDDRNAIQKFLQAGPANDDGKSARPSREDERHVGTSDADIADFLSSSPKPIDGHGDLGADPASPQSNGGSNSKGEFASPSQNPQTLGNTSEVGLRKSLELASPPGSRGGRSRSGSGVTEQVARLSLSKDDS